MSKEAVRQLVEGRLAAFTFDVIDKERKSYPNLPNKPTPTAGRWLRLRDIEFVLHKVTSIG